MSSVRTARPKTDHRGRASSLSQAAATLREQIVGLRRVGHRQVTGRLDALLARIQDLQKARRQLSQCIFRGWWAAAGQVENRISRAVGDLAYYLDQVGPALEAGKAAAPTQREIHADLLQLEHEFGQVLADPVHGVLAVRTDSIVLEDTYLGEFEIRLQVDRLDQDRPEQAFRVVALDPHPAASNSDVTHPHVSDDRLCAGDATVPIRAALDSGRICDFFLLVRSVLTTYNPHSPFVALGDWDGRPCYDCGYTVSEDDSCCCPTCQHEYCSDCTAFCGDCMETLCTGCLEECAACDEKFCTDCLARCPECGEPLCRSCLNDNQCPCQQTKESDHDEEDPDPKLPETTPAPSAEAAA